MTEHLCVLQCGRTYEHPHVCNPDRRWLAQLLHDIPPLHQRLGEALQKTASHTQRVSGTRNPPAPINLDSVDLSGPARPAALRLAARAILDGDEDAVGHLSIATTLDAMARDWRDVLSPAEHLPVPTVLALAQWLANRLEQACDTHPAIDEDATTLKHLRATLRAQLGEQPQRPQPLYGIPCPKCDLRALYRDTDWIACSNCGQLTSEQEYRQWTIELATQHKEAA